MEDTLRASKNIINVSNYVLILVLMEDTLRGAKSVKNLKVKNVLILVLMEDTLRAY